MGSQSLCIFFFAFIYKNNTFTRTGGRLFPIFSKFLFLLRVNGAACCRDLHLLTFQRILVNNTVHIGSALVRYCPVSSVGRTLEHFVRKLAEGALTLKKKGKKKDSQFVDIVLLLGFHARLR